MWKEKTLLQSSSTEYQCCLFFMLFPLEYMRDTSTEIEFDIVLQMTIEH